MPPRSRGAAPPPPPPALRLPPAPPGPEKPWHSYRFEIADASAVQAMCRGEATAEQQLRVLDLVISKLGGNYDLSFRPGGRGGARETDFAEGKRFVALQLVTMTKVNIGELEKRERLKTSPAR
jgi:hypothetical protein